jgi:hypothetical protein
LSAKPRQGWSWWYLLLIVQIPVALWVPFYNMAEPRLIGIPFFYWSQLALILIGAVLTAIVYFATEDSSSGPRPGDR